MKKLTTLFVLLSFVSLAQVTDKEKDLKTINNDTINGWKSGAVFNLNFSQVSLSNWAAGGNNSYSIQGLFSGHLNYVKNKFSWNNNLYMGYGVLNQKNEGTIKSDDRFELDSKLGYVAGKGFHYAAAVNFRTQFDDGFRFPNDSIKISQFMSPGYLVAALGIDKKKEGSYSLFFAPATAKWTFVGNQDLANAGAFGVEKATFNSMGELVTAGKTCRMEFGGYLKFTYQRDIVKNVNFSTKVDLFANYIDKPGNIDVNWDALLSFKVNKYLTTTISTTLIYDDDIDISVDDNDDGVIDAIGPRTQFKEVLAIGFTYKFP